MLLTSARVVPHIDRACFDSPLGTIVTAPSATVAVTSLLIARVSLPLPPLTVSTSPARLAWTPAGIVTGCLPTRDMVGSQSLGSKDATQHLAAHLGGAGLVVRHDAARRRQDRDAEPVIDPRQVDQLRIDPAAGLRHARNLADHRLAIDIFELDFELRDTGAHLLVAIAADIALALEHLEYVGAVLRGGCGDNGLARALAVADARQHVAERIAHRHRAPPLPARLDHARDLPGRGQLTHRDARQPELAVIAARPARKGAAVADARRRTVARHAGELQLRLKAILRRCVAVAGERLEARPARRHRLRHLGAPLVLLDRAFLCH